MQINPVIKGLLTALSGFILAFSAPGYDLWFIAWIGLSPFFIIINTTRTFKEILAYSFIFGFAYNLWYLHWLFSLHPLDWLGFSNFMSFLTSSLALLVVTTYCSIFFVLFAVIAVYIKKLSVSPYDNGIPNFLLVSIIWVIVFNKLSGCKLLFGFPWTLIEYSQYKNLFLIQIAEFFGSISISFLIVFFNLILANILLWMFRVEKIGSRYISKSPGEILQIVNSFLLILFLIVFSLVSSTILYKQNQQSFSNESKSICLLQGNLPLKVTRGSNLDINYAKKIYNNLIAGSNSKLFIAPEGALPVIFNSSSDIQTWLKTTSKKKQTDIISGTYCRSDELLTNCAVYYSGSTGNFSYYEKERLVPFGEFTPFAAILPGFLKTLASNVIGNGFSEGKKNSPVQTSIGKVGINICFELIFPGLIRKHSLQFANFLVNISDLSWFSNDLVKKQFLSFAVFRAIENRKWVVISANNGVSAFIEPNGSIRSQSLPNTQGVLLDWINPNSKITIYSKYGW